MAMTAMVRQAARKARMAVAPVSPMVTRIWPSLPAQIKQLNAILAASASCENSQAGFALLY